MKISRALAALGVAAVIGGCASTPTGPSVMVLPGPGKTMDQFQADDGHCRQIATSELQHERQGSVPAQQRYDMTYMQCMYAAGNQIPGTSRPGYGTPGAAAPAWDYLANVSVQGRVDAFGFIFAPLRTGV